MSDCPTCGDSFKSENGVKTHHKQIHGESIRGVELVCLECDEIYVRSKSHARGSKFCSKECQGKNKSSGTSVLICENCNKNYEVQNCRRGESKFCSEECQFKDRYKSRKSLVCENCDEKYKCEQRRLDKSRFCSITCKNEYYTKDIGLNKYPYEWDKFSLKYRDWVGSCENCGSCDNLHVHHDNPLSEGGGLWDNTFTVLCIGCHLGEFERWHGFNLN